ncbi:Hypothetical_protein [Hexamita inflata]|uniref:Hypothetical_protein n=1 Tax=Hexamita inflata TaxID=28002 RepID=A0AA86V5Y3_9EUKA|nr:Hypothetical protein HINF_LOCUS65222 [Hexamita inflata]
MKTCKPEQFIQQQVSKEEDLVFKRLMQKHNYKDIHHYMQIQKGHGSVIDPIIVDQLAFTSNQFSMYEITTCKVSVLINIQNTESYIKQQQQIKQISQQNEILSCKPIQCEHKKQIMNPELTVALKNRLAQIEVLKTQIQKLSTAQALKTAEINLNIEPETDSKQETQPEEHNELKLEELTIQEEKPEQIIEAKQFKVFAQKNCLKLEADGQFYFCGLIEANFEVKEGTVFMKCRQSYKEVTVKFQDPEGQKWRMIKRLL